MHTFPVKKQHEISKGESYEKVVCFITFLSLSQAAFVNVCTPMKQDRKNEIINDLQNKLKKDKELLVEAQKDLSILKSARGKFQAADYLATHKQLTEKINSIKETLKNENNEIAEYKKCEVMSEEQYTQYQDNLKKVREEAAAKIRERDEKILEKILETYAEMLRDNAKEKVELTKYQEYNACGNQKIEDFLNNLQKRMNLVQKIHTPNISDRYSYYKINSELSKEIAKKIGEDDSRVQRILNENLKKMDDVFEKERLSVVINTGGIPSVKFTKAFEFVDSKKINDSEKSQFITMELLYTGVGKNDHAHIVIGQGKEILLQEIKSIKFINHELTLNLGNNIAFKIKTGYRDFNLPGLTVEEREKIRWVYQNGPIKSYQLAETTGP